MVRALERTTRELVEAEQLVGRLRLQQGALRDQLLAAVGGRAKRADVPGIVLDTARAVESGASTAGAVAAALGITAGCARMRLKRALEANLVERSGHGAYRAPGAPSVSEEVSAS